MEGVGSVDGVGGVIGNSVCRVLVGGLNLLDHDLLALQQVCLAATAMGAGLAVLDRRKLWCLVDVGEGDSSFREVLPLDVPIKT